MKLKPVLLTASLYVSGLLFGSQDTEVQRQELTESFSVLFGSGGNVGVFAGEDGEFFDEEFDEVEDGEFDDASAPLVPE